MITVADYRAMMPGVIEAETAEEMLRLARERWEDVHILAETENLSGLTWFKRFPEGRWETETEQIRWVWDGLKYIARIWKKEDGENIGSFMQRMGHPREGNWSQEKLDAYCAEIQRRRYFSPDWDDAYMYGFYMKWWK